MNLIKLAIDHQRWDLAAHVIILAAARAVNQEVKESGKKNNKKGGRS